MKSVSQLILKLGEGEGMYEKSYHGKPVHFWRGITKKRISLTLGNAIAEAAIKKLEEQEAAYPFLADYFFETLGKAAGRPIGHFGCVVLHFRNRSKKVDIGWGCDFGLPEEAVPQSEKSRTMYLMEQFLAREKLHPGWERQLSEEFDRHGLLPSPLWLLRFEIKLPFLPHKVALASYGDWATLRGVLFDEELPMGIGPSCIQAEKGAWVTPEQATEMIEQFGQLGARMVLISPTPK